MAAQFLPISLAQGDHIRNGYLFKNTAGNPIDNTGARIQLTVRATKDAAAALLELDSDVPANPDGTFTVDGAAGTFTPTGCDSDVWSIADGDYFYSMRVTWSDGEGETYFKGPFILTTEPVL